MPAGSGAVSGDKSAWRSKKKQAPKKQASPDETKGYAEKIVIGPIDLTFFLIVMILLVIGIIMMFSAGYAWAIAEGNAGTYYVQRQLGMAAAGLAGMFVISFFNYHKFKKAWIAYSAFIICTVLLILALGGPFATPHNGSYRWVTILGIEFQPSEIMKMSIILLFAYLIANNHSKMRRFSYGIVPFIAFLGIVVVLLLREPHLSGTLIICAIGAIMMYVGGSRPKHLIILGIIGAVLITAYVFYLMQVKGIGYFEKRMVSWLDPFNDEASDATWQTRNSLIAIGSGGIFGLGLGNSRQKFLYLPESKNDFVFAVVCEEFGLIGAVVVIILFLLFIIRGFYLASKAPDKFGMMLTVGIILQIGLQAFLNIAVVTNTIPNTGVSLPFFSYGGTALVMQLVEMGVVLNISRQSIVKT